MMDNGKPTPGPWLVATSNSWRRIVSERGDPVCVPTIQRSDNHPDLEFPNGGEDGIDARVMIAAPDLYEALEYMVRVCEQAHLSGFGMDQARAALAKVKGK